MATLQARLDKHREHFAAKAPPEKLAVMRRATQDLIDSGAAERAHGVGSTLPPFTLQGASGASVSSADLLSRGPLVMTFFRGHW